ncbi:hypothetical protein BDQ17DRAFT_1260891 [Cyathus striatus]|nr:hypothetical protein BDQ17DRAFT_1260891 [Cyathus striatus]
MTVQPNPRIVFTKRPAAHQLPVVGEHITLDNSQTIDVDNIPLNGGFLTKTLILSPEPAMRERMRDPSIISYTTAFEVGGPFVGFGVVKVLRSEKDGVNVGDYMYGLTVWEAYTVQPYIEIPNLNGMYPLSKYTSVMGTPGLTAFVGFEGIIQGKEGETLFVSSGASGVGAMIIQLAKLKGMKVIASAGSDVKVEYVKSLGADVAFNYKKESYESVLAKHGPINAFWDNVGAEALDAALVALTPRGRVAICGTSATDTVSPSEHYRLKNAYLIMKKRLSIKGFIVPEYIPEFIGRFFAEVPALMGQGKIRSEESIVKGIENTPKAFVDMLGSGHETAGKPVVIVAED